MDMVCLSPERRRAGMMFTQQKGDVLFKALVFSAAALRRLRRQHHLRLYIKLSRARPALPPRTIAPIIQMSAPGGAPRVRRRRTHPPKRNHLSATKVAPSASEPFVFQVSAGAAIIHSDCGRGADRLGGEPRAAGSRPAGAPRIGRRRSRRRCRRGRRAARPAPPRAGGRPAGRRASWPAGQLATAAAWFASETRRRPGPT